jgi:hypothetical protein
MSSDPNYPDDIRMYDHDPRSPFYDGDVLCPTCGDELDEVDFELFKCNDCNIIVNTEPYDDDR